MRRLYNEADARRLLNPGPVAIVTTAWRDMTNAAPVAWTAPFSMDPPLVGIVLHPLRRTADMIRYSDEFAINIPGPDLLKQTAFLGSVSGEQHNKIEEAGLELFNGLYVTAPLIEGCLAWIECGLHDTYVTGDHLLVIGSVAKVHALDEAYEEVWKLEERRYRPLMYRGGNRYGLLGDPLEAHFEVDAQGGLITETPEEREAREEREGQEAELQRTDPERPRGA